ncbi:hypothetical protein BDR26DRAFT_901745 [Obelidium mucronatum]|nr:hypothetical protein BDR26DRAFT_901745 [Obelidium mucronatum]
MISSGFRDVEQNWMSSLSEILIDSFRFCNPFSPGQYTTWFYHNRRGNIGMRYDGIFSSNNIKPVTASHGRTVHGSDHIPVISTFDLSEFVDDLIATESLQTRATYDEVDAFEEEDSEYLDLKHEAESEALFVTSKEGELIKGYWWEHANAFRTTTELEDLFEEDFNATTSPAVEIGEFSLTALATPSVSTDFYVPERAGSLCAGTLPQASPSLSLNSPQITHLENTQVLEAI